MTTMTTNPNGRTRKSLGEQIDRLDAILDGLSDALTEAVAAAVSEAAGRAVREAVQAVLAEALTYPAVQEQALPADAPPASPKASPSVLRPLARLATWLGARARSCVQACLAGLCWARDLAVRLSFLAGGRLRAALLAAGAVAAGVAHSVRARLAHLMGRLSGWAMGLAATAGPALRRLMPAGWRRAMSPTGKALHPC
jgi:hypothetical protein